MPRSSSGDRFGASSSAARPGGERPDWRPGAGGGLDGAGLPASVNCALRSHARPSPPAGSVPRARRPVPTLVAIQIVRDAPPAHRSADSCLYRLDGKTGPPGCRLVEAVDCGTRRTWVLAELETRSLGTCSLSTPPVAGSGSRAGDFRERSWPECGGDLPRPSGQGRLTGGAGDRQGGWRAPTAAGAAARCERRERRDQHQDPHGPRPPAGG